MGSCMSMKNEEQLGGGEHEKVQIRRMCRSDVEESMRKRETDHVKRIYRSDEDRGRYIADPNVDTKARDFINLFHKSRVMDETNAGDQKQLSVTTS
ncbi:hypothetical protein ACLOJK_022129 [Asimina triloba]